ncbi:MAG: hypothetical protein ACRCV0_01785 [Brevinema sp.]
MNFEKELRNCLSLLSEERPIFHSEADFQFALAWKIKENLPDVKVRLEYPVYNEDKNNKKKNMYIDIVVFLDEKFIPIELKYITAPLYEEKKFEHRVAQEAFLLKDHLAYPINRHNFLEDIERIEKLSEYPNFIEGYTVWLSNCQNYWLGPKTNETTCKNFTIHHEAKISKGSTLEWAHNTCKRTVDAHKILTLNNGYKFLWEEYSNIVNAEKNNIFQYCLTKIDKV